MAIAVGFAFLAALGFAVGTIFMRVGTQRLSPPTATLFNVITGAVLVLSLALGVSYSEVKSLDLQTLGWFALMGTMAYPFARVLVNTAITMVGASGAAPMGSIQPILALGLAVAFLDERPNLLVIAGTVVVVGGLITIVLRPNPVISPGRRLATNRLGYLLAIGASATFATRDVISRHVVTGIASPLVSVAFALTFGGLILLVLTHRDVLKSLRQLPRKDVAVCCLAGVCQGLAVASLFQALGRAPVSVVSPINATNPLITLALVHIFLRQLESVNRFLVVGTLLSVGGVIAVVLGATF